MTIDEAIVARAQDVIDRKYTASADDRQRSMGLAYVVAERQDLAKETARFVVAETAEMRTALCAALVAMKLASELPGVSDEYDFGYAIEQVTAALSGETT